MVMQYSIWFKASMVRDILTGQKTFTSRAKQPAYQPGDTLLASVGPRPPFAKLRVISVTRTATASLDAEYRQALRDLYGDVDFVYRIDFSLDAASRREMERLRAETETDAQFGPLFTHDSEPKRRDPERE
jgi:hypothetical protein